MVLKHYKKKGTFIKNQNSHIIATSPIEYNYEFNEYYKNLRNKQNSAEYCCSETIKFAYFKNPNYISKEFNHIKIEY